MIGAVALEDKRALHGAAAARILSGCAVLGLLISNIRHRDLLFGPGSVWAEPVQGGVGGAPHYWPTELVARLGSTAFLLLLPRSHRPGAVLDRRMRTRAWWVCFCSSARCRSSSRRRWWATRATTSSASAWCSCCSCRRAITGRSMPGVARDGATVAPIVPLWLSNGVHNIALAALAFQVVLVYFSAGMAKARGDLWQHGTALYYPLQLQEFRPFPFLNDLVHPRRARRRHRDVRRHPRRARLRLRPAPPGGSSGRDRRRDRPARLDRGADGVAVVLVVDARLRRRLRQHEHLRRARSPSAGSGEWATPARRPSPRSGRIARGR